VVGGLLRASLTARGLDPEPLMSDSEVSTQAAAKAAFDVRLGEMLTAAGGNMGKRLNKVAQIAESSTLGLTLMYIEILNKVNLPQVFLWMQEKALFGMGALLHNQQEGVDFRVADLVRNLVLSCFMHLPLVGQEKVYRELWLVPIELPIAHEIDAMIEAFIECKSGEPISCGRLAQSAPARLPGCLDGGQPAKLAPSQPVRHKSSAENFVLSMSAQPAGNSKKHHAMLVYARFVSITEALKNQMEDASQMPPPSAKLTHPEVPIAPSTFGASKGLEEEATVALLAEMASFAHSYMNDSEVRM
jgi:hypothetical protein